MAGNGANHNDGNDNDVENDADDLQSNGITIDSFDCLCINFTVFLVHSRNI